MKLKLPALAALFLIAVPAHAVMVMKMKQTQYSVPGQPQAQGQMSCEMISAVDEGHGRVDADCSGRRISTIIVQKPRELIMMDVGQKAYHRISGEDLDAMAKGPMEFA